MYPGEAEGLCCQLTQNMPEPGNRYDPNAIAALNRGEAYGTLGYVGREFTDAVRELVAHKGVMVRNLHVEVVDLADFGDHEVIVRVS